MRALCLSVFLASVLAPSLVAAMGVTPLIVELSSGTSNRSGQIIVNNDAAAESPIEVRMYRIELDENGGQTRIPSTSDFVIFPPMKLVPPHSKQVFRIQWAGPVLQKSQTYSLIVAQPPVQMPGGQSGVKIDFNFEIIVNVAPPAGNRSLELLQASVQTEKGKHFPVLVLRNSGYIHALLSDASVTLHSGAWSRTIVSADFRQLIGVGLVQPGKTRRIMLPVELPPGINSVAAEVRYEGASISYVSTLR